jgi:hypothetical protein
MGLIPANHHVQCDDGPSRQADMSATSSHVSELFSVDYEYPSKSWRGWHDEERGRFPNFVEIDFASISPVDNVVILTSDDGQTCLAALAIGRYGRNESHRDVNGKFDACFLYGPINCGTLV